MFKLLLVTLCVMVLMQTLYAQPLQDDNQPEAAVDNSAEPSDVKDKLNVDVDKSNAPDKSAEEQDVAKEISDEELDVTYDELAASDEQESEQASHTRVRRSLGFDIEDAWEKHFKPAVKEVWEKKIKEEIKKLLRKRFCGE